MTYYSQVIKPQVLEVCTEIGASKEFTRLILKFERRVNTAYNLSVNSSWEYAVNSEAYYVADETLTLLMEKYLLELFYYAKAKGWWIEEWLTEERILNGEIKSWQVDRFLPSVGDHMC